ncbi:MAG: hypothetical protein ACRC6X_06545 [Culicoidibacterales bacterium]
MGNKVLYGHKKWFRVNSKNGKGQVTIKLEREWHKEGYIVKGKKEENIDKSKVIRELNDFWGRKIESNRIQEGNILAKQPQKYLKGEEKELQRIEILKQSKQLAAEKKTQGETKRVTRLVLEKELSENHSFTIKNGEEFPFKCSQIKILIYTNEKDYAENLNKSAILIREIDEQMIERKQQLLMALTEINRVLWKITRNIKMEELKNRKYIDIIKTTIKSQIEQESVLIKIENLAENINQNQKLIDYISFLIDTTSEPHKIIFEKMEAHFLNQRTLTDDDFVTFLIGTLQAKDCIKRIIVKEANNSMEGETYKESQIKTYINKDKHTEQNGHEEFIKKYLNKEAEIKSDIKDILAEYNILELGSKLIKEVKIKRDTNLYKTFKDHYQNKTSETCFNGMDSTEKQLRKLIYRYLKGRINKIIESPTYYQTLEKAFTPEKLAIKLATHVKQFILENLLYIGKVTQYELTKPNSIDFQKIHAKEELYTEILTLFSVANTKLANIFGDNSIDFYGGKNCLYESIKIKYDITQNIKFLQKSDGEIDIIKGMTHYINRACDLRNAIVHGKIPEVQEIAATRSVVKEFFFSQTMTDSEFLTEQIERERVTDKTICTALNIDIIFNHKNAIITEINKQNEQESTLDCEPFFPRFNKISGSVSQFVYAEITDPIVAKIVEPAFLYVAKQLYLAELHYDIPKGYLRMQLGEKDNPLDLQEHFKKQYQRIQKQASAGNRNIMRNFQGKYIDSFMAYFKTKILGQEGKTIAEIFYLTTMSGKELKETVQNRSASYPEKYLLKRRKVDIKITSDFSYIILMTALLAEPEYINLVANRFRATARWLAAFGEEEQNYEDIARMLYSYSEINSEKKILEEQTYLELPSIVNNETEIRRRCEKRLEAKTDNGLKEAAKMIADKYIKIENELPNFEVCKYKHDFKSEKQYMGYISGIMEIIGIIGEEVKKEKAQEKTQNISKYKIEMDKIINQMNTEQKKNYFDLYYQKTSEAPQIIFDKYRYKEIARPSFEYIYDNFIKTDIINIEKPIVLTDEDIKNHQKVDKIITKINTTLKGKSKHYKQFKQEILANREAESVRLLLNEEGFETNEDFEKAVISKNNYEKQTFILNLQASNYIYNSMLQIAWKLAMQISRLERDILHLDLAVAKIITTTSKEHRTFFNLPVETNEEKIRNYYAHFHMIRDPFEKSIVTQAQDLAKLLKYRTKYNNSTQNIILQAFKKELSYNYPELKKPKTLSEITTEQNWETLVKNRKASILELNLKYDYKTLARKILLQTKDGK